MYAKLQTFPWRIVKDRKHADVILSASQVKDALSNALASLWSSSITTLEVTFFLMISEINLAT